MGSDTPVEPKKRRRSVVNGVLQAVSVSQINTFWDKDGTSKEGCNRRWYFQKVVGLKEEQTPQQALGVKIHLQIEHYLKTGENGLGKEAMAGFAHLPPPLAPTLAEYPLEAAGEWVVDGVRFSGSIDALDPRNPLRPHMYDWKSTSDFRWSKSSEQWKKEIQQIVYAKRIADLYPSAREFPWTAVYFRTEGAPKALPVRIVSTLTEVEERWLTVRRLIRDIQTVAGLDTPAKVKPNHNACWAFRRRCPFAAECSKYQRTKEEKIMAFADRLRAQLAAESGTAAPASQTPAAPAATPPAPPPAPVMTEAKPKPAFKIEDESKVPDETLKAQAAQRAAIKLGGSYLLEDGRTVEVVEIDGITYRGRVGDHVGPSIQGLLTSLGAETARIPPAVIQSSPPPSHAPVLAPDAPKSNPELAAACAFCPEDAKDRQHTRENCPVLRKEAEEIVKAEAAGAITPAQATAELEKLESQPAPTAEEKTTRKRRTKAEMEAARAAEAAQAPAAEKFQKAHRLMEEGKTSAAETALQDAAATADREEASEPQGFALFVNALPLGVSVKESQDYVESVLAKVNAAADVPDYRLVDYGKGAGLVAACAREYPPTLKTLILITRESAASAIIADALAPLARYVVRGV